MSKLVAHVSGVGPLSGALDGSVKRPVRRQRALREPTITDLTSRWHCPVCQREATDAADQARHIAKELSAAQNLVMELQREADWIRNAIPVRARSVSLARLSLTDEECRQAHAVWAHARKNGLQISSEVLEAENEYVRRKHRRLREKWGADSKPAEQSA